MNRHDHRTAAERRQRADDECASVARPHADALAFAHAETVELDAQRLDLAPKRLVIQRAAGINDGSAGGPLAGGTGEGFKNIHARRLNFRLARSKARLRCKQIFQPNCLRTCATASSSGRPAA